MNGMTHPGWREASEPSPARLAHRRECTHRWLAAQLIDSVRHREDRKLPFTGKPGSTVSEVLADNIAGPIREALFAACSLAMAGKDAEAGAVLRVLVQLSGEDFALCHADEAMGEES